MKLIKQNINGCYKIENEVFKDKRGLFFECINEKILNKLSVARIDQTNISKSHYGVFRGFHYQVEEQLTQFVTCIKGEVLDFALDIRKDSSTFGNVVEAKLSEENHHTLYLPPGLAHAFLSVSNESILLYHVAGKYVKGKERGVNFNSLGLQLPFYPKIINDRDLSWPNFEDCEYI
jgi:dTDP-4-dehydrorhamnose 3,5-epimerase